MSDREFSEHSQSSTHLVFWCAGTPTTAIEGTEDVGELVCIWSNSRRAFLYTEEDRVIIQSEGVGTMQDRHVAVLAR